MDKLDLQRGDEDCMYTTENHKCLSLQLAHIISKHLTRSTASSNQPGFSPMSWNAVMISSPSVASSSCLTAPTAPLTETANHAQVDDTQDTQLDNQMDDTQVSMPRRRTTLMRVSALETQ